MYNFDDLWYQLKYSPATMMKLILLLVMLLVILDSLIIIQLRSIQIDILARNGNRRSAKKVYKAQSFYNRIILTSISEHLKKYYIKEFRRFNTFYKVILGTMVPQYLLLLILYYFNNNVVLFVLFFLCFVKMVLSFFLSHFFPNGVGHISKYGLK